VWRQMRQPIRQPYDSGFQASHCLSLRLVPQPNPVTPLSISADHVPIYSVGYLHAHGLPQARIIFLLRAWLILCQNKPALQVYSPDTCNSFDEVVMVKCVDQGVIVNALQDFFKDVHWSDWRSSVPRMPTLYLTAQDHWLALRARQGAWAVSIPDKEMGGLNPPGLGQTLPTQ
jgi:hypothetical protein